MNNSSGANEEDAMNDPIDDAWLWDGSGRPDETTAALAAALGEQRYRRTAADDRPSRPRGRLVTWAAIASVAAAGLLLWLAGPHVDLDPEPATEGGWTARVSEDGQGVERTVAVGEWLRLDDAETARLDVADVGRLDVRPGSELRLVRSDAEQHRVELRRGSVHAFVDAPPRLFVVDTPAATAVDMGCEYELTVDESGDGELAVHLGWVALERDGRDVFVPAGHSCPIASDVGPGTPRSDDAAEELVAALDRLDSAADARARSDASRAALAACDDGDAVTLWHLLPHAEAGSRTAVYERLAAVEPPPDDVTRDGALALDRVMLERWFDRLW